jgi:hypothetical protein
VIALEESFEYLFVKVEFNGVVRGCDRLDVPVDVLVFLNALYVLQKR